MFGGLPHVQQKRREVQLQRVAQLFDGHGWLQIHRVIAAKFFIIDQIAEGRLFPAKWTAFFRSHLQGAEFQREGIDHYQPPHGRLPDVQQKFDGLQGLQGADQSRQNPQHPTGGAVGYLVDRRWLGKQTAVAGGTAGGVEKADLAFEAVDAAVNQGFAAQKAGVVEQVSGRVIIGSVDDDIVIRNDLPGVAGADGFRMHPEVGIRIEGLQAAGEDLRFGKAEIRRGKLNLALQVAFFDPVEIRNADGTDAGPGQVEGGGSAQTAGPDDQYPGLQQFLLPFPPDFGKEQVARIAMCVKAAQFS